MTSSLTRGKPADKGLGRPYRWLGWTGLALGLISLVSTGTPPAPAPFPFLAIGTLLFVAWIGTLTVALLRSTATGSRIASRLDSAGRASGETDEV